MRDEFAATVKEVLAKRVGQRCSNPRCRLPTSGPRIDPAKAVNTGVAAHITAASEDGPRFDHAKSPLQRSSVENGIWLCQTCAKLVDNDPARYSVTFLLAWKAEAEDAAAKALESRDNTVADGDADSRPWLSVTCRLGSGFQPGTTQFGVGGYYLSLKGLAKNHGRSPATGVIFRAELGLLGKGRGREDLLNGFCDRFRNTSGQDC